METARNDLAKQLRALHQPGNPLILLNAYDPPSARAVASLPNCKALATASYAVAEAVGLRDDELTLDHNLRAVKLIAQVASEFNKPLTADMQGGYGEQLEACIAGVIQAGAVGCNLEDVDEVTGQLYDVDVAVERVRRAVKIASENGVPDFVVNARSDTMLFGGSVDDAIARGQKYLDAGAANVFIWGGRKRGGLTRDEVEQLTRGLQGRLNVSMRVAPGNLTVKELADIGVARISTGPGLQMFAMEALQRKAEELLQ